MERGRRSLRRAAEMGVQWVVFHLGTTADITDVNECMEISKQRNLEVFGEMLLSAKALGLEIAIENMPQKSSQRFAATADDLLWLCKMLNDKSVGVCWDTSHASISRLDQPVQLRQLGKHLVALHISDSDGQADRHWAPLRGTIGWRGVIQVLRDVDYQAPFNLEVPGECMHLPSELKRLKLPFLFALSLHLSRPEFREGLEKSLRYAAQKIGLPRICLRWQPQFRCKRI
jgi:sugar phosphate isomerase/epimerase